MSCDGLVRSPFDHCSENYNVLSQMMRDQFANYVVQKMFDLADTKTKTEMITSIRPHIASLKRYNYGKHIMGGRVSVHSHCSILQPSWRSG